MRKLSRLPTKISVHVQLLSTRERGDKLQRINPRTRYYTQQSGAVESTNLPWPESARSSEATDHLSGGSEKKKKPAFSRCIRALQLDMTDRSWSRCLPASQPRPRPSKKKSLLCRVRRRLQLLPRWRTCTHQSLTPTLACRCSACTPFVTASQAMKA